MAFYCQNMLEMAIILAEHDPIYEEIAFKFVQHFLWIAYAMDRRGEHHDEMWDEEEGFFYDLLRLPDGQAMRLKVRSLVGLLPLCASTVFEADSVTRNPRLMELIAQFRKRHPELASQVAPTDAGFIGYKDRRLLSILNKRKLERVLGYLLDENEFLGPHGIRSLSRYHLEHPFVFNVAGQEYRVQYLPAESNTGMFGGNSNWRGPVWMPVNLLIVRALLNLYHFYGDEFKVQCPTGSGQHMTLFEVAQEIVRRLTGTFLRGADGKRPVYGGTAKFQEDPHWRDLILFYEYFHGDNGAGLGASHQTGWTGLVAPLLDLFGRLDAKTLLETERGRVAARLIREQVGGVERSRSEAKPVMGDATLPGAVPGQYPRLADRAVAGSRPARDAGRHSRCRAGSAGREGLRLGLVPERLADRPGGAGDLARECRVAPRVRGNAAGPDGRRYCRLRVRHPELHRPSRSRRRRRRSLACGSGCSNGD